MPGIGIWKRQMPGTAALLLLRPGHRAQVICSPVSGCGGLQSCGRGLQVTVWGATACQMFGTAWSRRSAATVELHLQASRRKMPGTAASAVLWPARQALDMIPGV